MKKLSILTLAFFLSPDASGVDPAASPPCEEQAGGLSACPAGERSQVDADLNAFRQRRPALEQQEKTNQGRCDQAGTAVSSSGATRAVPGQRTGNADVSGVVRENVRVLRECKRVMGEIAGHHRSMQTTAQQRLRGLGAASTNCQKAKKAVYECLKRETKAGADRVQGNADKYGGLADQLDPAGAEADRRARRMGGDPNNPGGGGEQAGAGGGDSKKGDDKAGGGGGGSPDMSAMSKMAEQAMKAKQDADAKAEAERQKAEAERKAQEAKEKQARIQACQDTKAKRAAAIQKCDWDNNPNTNVVTVRVANEKCKDDAKSMYPVDELTNCALTP